MTNTDDLYPQGSSVLAGETPNTHLCTHRDVLFDYFEREVQGAMRGWDNVAQLAVGMLVKASSMK